MKKIVLIFALSLGLMSFTKDNLKKIDNTVCASGNIETAEFGTVTIRVCYTGPETGSALAAKHRALIETVRSQAQ